MKSTPLYIGMQQSGRIIQQVLQGQSLSVCLNNIPATHKGLTQSLVYYTLRQLPTAQFLQKQVLKKVPHKRFEGVFLVALSLIIAQQTEDTSPNAPIYRIETITNQVVEAIKKDKKLTFYKNLMNGCIRHVLREFDMLYKQGQQDLSVKYNMPLWWIQKLQADYPEQWENMIIESHKTPKMTLRVNPLQYDTNTYQNLLLQQGIHSYVLGASSLMLEQAVPVQSLPGFDQGACFVQDWGAQMAGNILINLAKQHYPNAIKGATPQDTTPTLRILDACAAPGGKTTHLLEHLHTSLDVIDVSANRLQRVQENLDRLKISQQHLRLINTDAREKAPWFTEQYDFILADVPCTASGVIRRHPDIQYLRQPSDITQTVQLQREIIQNLWDLLKENGYFLYMTCSIFQEEGENQVQWMLEHCSQINRLNCVGQLLPTQTDTMSHDGFFIALLQKTTCNQ